MVKGALLLVKGSLHLVKGALLLVKVHYIWLKMLYSWLKAHCTFGQGVLLLVKGELLFVKDNDASCQLSLLHTGEILLPFSGISPKLFLDLDAENYNLKNDQSIMVESLPTSVFLWGIGLGSPSLMMPCLLW